MRASLWGLLSAGGLLQSRIMLDGTHYSAWVGVLETGTLGGAPTHADYRLPYIYKY